MKKGMKVVSLALAFALTVTSVPNEWTTQVAKVEAAESGDSQTQVKQALTWNAEDKSVDAAKLNEEKDVYATTIKYGEEPGEFRYTNDLDTGVGYDGYGTVLALDQGTVREALELDDTAAVSVDGVQYKWYVVDDKGNKTELEDKTGRYLYLSWSDDAELQVNNGTGDKTFVCELTVTDLMDDEWNNYKTEELTGYDWTIERKFTLQYAGNKVAKSELDTYFSGVDKLKDETFIEHDSSNVESFSRLMDVDELGIEDSAGRYNYTWVTYFADGTKQESKKSEYNYSFYNLEKTGRMYETVYDEETDEEEKKRVDHYECKIELCYGYQVIDTVSKNFYFRYSPIDFEDSEGMEVSTTIRGNGTAYMDAAAEIYDTEAVEPNSITYQWYRVDADGKEELLKGETTPTYAVRVPNADVSYKVVVSAAKKEGYIGPAFSDLVRTYRFQSSGGYLLKDRSWSSYEINLGDTQELYVKPQVDDGYELKYKWQRFSYVDEKQEDGQINKKVVKETVGTENKYEVKPTKLSDFENISGSKETDWYDCNYSVTVSVMKGDKEVETYNYYFSIREDISYEVLESSPSDQVLDLGDDLNLFVKTKVKDCYRLEQNWYKKLDEEKVKRTYDFETGDYVYESVDPEFALTESADIEKVSSYGEYDGDQYVYTRTYYKKVGQGAEYSRKGTDDAGEPVDVRGDYMCRLEMFRVEEPGDGKDGTDGNGGKDEEGEKVEPLTGTSDRNFTVTYDSDLSAYAKNDWLAVKEGEKARFRIVAQTKNNDIYNIQYLWEKWDETTEEYVKVKNAAGEEVTGAVYEIAQASAQDAGRYRVTVSDATGEKLSPIDLTLSVEESDIPDADVETSVTEVSFTPEYSYYDLAVGQTADLNVDMKLSEKVDVFYAWYRDEAVDKREGTNQSYEYDWELLGQDKNTYKLTVQNEDDFTTYRCVAIYRKKNSEYARREFRFVVRQAYSAYLEKMTPGTQIKRVGDSATYSVRLITDAPDMDPRYEWYRGGEKIEGANSATYQVDKLAKEDFGTLRCEVKDAKSGERLAASTSFTTRVYLNGAYLDTNNVIVETELNAPETVLGPPAVVRGEGLELTYQWYRTNDKGNETIIYGATKSSYTIDEFGRNDFCTYACRVYANGYYLDTYYTTTREKGEEQPDDDVPPISIELREGYEKDVEAYLGKSAAFAVTAKSNLNLALKYQWYYGSDEESGKAIGGATSNEYVIDIVTPAKKGSYFCVVTDEEGNRIRSEIFTLTTTTGLTVDNEGLYWSDAIGVQTTFDAQNVTLTATASASEEYGYTPFFQWYHGSISDKGLIYGATSRELVLPNIDEDALGMYYCVVQDNSGQQTKTLSWYVYVNTGLNVMPSTYYVTAKEDGSANMYVTAVADAGYDITYEWSKYDENADVKEYPDYFVPIEGATGAAYTISPLKRADYGRYRCVIRTRGERNVYEFKLEPGYSVQSNRTFAFQGDEVTVSSAIENQASDLTYEYQWYEQEPATGTFRKINGATAPACTRVVPKLNLSEQFTANNKLGYVPVSYKCILTITGVNEDGSEYKETMNYNAGVRVLPDIDFSQDRLPETNHPNDKAFDIQAYRAPGAEKLKLDFSGQTDLGSADLYIIARDGTYWTTADVDQNGSRWQSPEGVTVPGDSVVLLMNGNSRSNSYGYKVLNIEKIVTPQPGTELKPGEQQPGDAQNGAGKTAQIVPGPAITATGAKAVKKGSKYTIKGLKYKVTSASAKKRTVTVTGAKSKKTASVNIPATVKISGKKYKVTAIAAKAFKGYAKLKSATIGANVKSIGANAFANDKKLKKLTIKGTGLKSVGKGAFGGVPKKAKAGVPKKSKKAYKKVLKKGGFKGKVK